MESKVRGRVLSEGEVETMEVEEMGNRGGVLRCEACETTLRSGQALGEEMLGRLGCG